MPEKPIPPIQPWAEPFWAAAREEKLLIQHCRGCDRYVFYPRLQCPACFSAKLEWIEACGRGRVYTYSVVLNNPPSAFQNDVPFVIAIVELEEGVRLMTNIVGCKPDAVRCDMPVEVVFEKATDEITLPKFTPAAAEDAPHA
jgi:uncharacterized OB-fold protein